MSEGTILIAPSVLSADFTRLGDELDSIRTADLLHFDVMDGHFVPNLSFGLPILRQAKAASDLPVDVHLMVSNPDEVVGAYLEAGADYVSVHAEAATHIHRIVTQIHAAGAKAAVALNPGTAISVLEDILPDLDMVLLMSVDPGFGGQRYIEHTYDKLRRLRAMCHAMGVSPLVEVDGGITTGNVEDVVAAGADVLVAGSTVFKAPVRAEAIAALRESGTRGLARRA
jgi:ribulose-phosphate 3-epimerase